MRMLFFARASRSMRAANESSPPGRIATSHSTGPRSMNTPYIGSSLSGGTHSRTGPNTLLPWSRAWSSFAATSSFGRDPPHANAATASSAALRIRQRRAGGGLGLLARHAGRELDDLEPVARRLEHAEVRDDERDDARRRQR